MENALSRIGCRFINRNDFIINFLDEFQIPAPTMHMHKNLKILYETFPGWETQEVDSYALLCTFLSVLFKDIVEANPEKVFCNFCDIFCPISSKMKVKDILQILYIGCVTNSDFMYCIDKLLVSLKVIQSKSEPKAASLSEISIKKSEVKILLDHNPSLLIHFRDSILTKLNAGKRVDMLNSKEVRRYLFVVDDCFTCSCYTHFH